MDESHEGGGVESPCRVWQLGECLSRKSIPNRVLTFLPHDEGNTWDDSFIPIASYSSVRFNLQDDLVR